MLTSKENKQITRTCLELCVLFFYSIHKTVCPADADKIANLAQHSKSLGTAALNDEALTTSGQNAGAPCLVNFCTMVA